MSKGKIATLIFLFFFGCQSSGIKDSSMVRVNLGADPHTMDPSMARDPNSQVLMRMLFEGLTRIGPSDQPELAIASSVHISEDVKAYVFTLRHSQWSNGKPVKAQDFAYAWRRILRPNFICDNAYQLYFIKNAKSVKEGKLPIDQLGIYTPDDHTIVLELEYPIPYLLELLATPYFFPVHQETDEENPHWSEKVKTYVSNGPFVLKDRKHQDQIVLGKNPHYWDANTVQISGIALMMVEGDTELKLFEKKELDWAGSPLTTIPVDALAHWKEFLHVKPRDETAFLRANNQTVPLCNVKMRKALALAIDRKQIIDHVLQGGQLPAQRLVPPSMQLQKEPYFSDNDSQEAKKLFKESLLELGIAKTDFPKIKLTYIHSERAHLIAQTLQQQWFETLGIHVDLEAVERKVYFDQIAKQNYDLAFCSWGADFHDPVNFLEVFKYKSQSTNNTHWENAQYRKGLEDSYRFFTPEERLEQLTFCERILMEEMPIIPIFHYTMLYMKNENLHGVFLSSMGHLDFKWATFHNEK